MATASRYVFALLALGASACGDGNGRRDSGSGFDAATANDAGGVADAAVGPDDTSVGDAAPGRDAGARVCIPNGEVVSDAARTGIARDIPLFIRYPEGATGSLPVVVFSHGGALAQVAGLQSSCWGRTLTRAGFVVIHVSHPDNPHCDDVSCSAEGLAFYDALCDAHGMSADECAAQIPDTRNIMMRAHDTRAVLDDLDCIEATVQARAGDGVTLDRSRIALMGWSAGTGDALYLAGARALVGDTVVELPDSRVAAVVTSSPQRPGDSGWYCTQADDICCLLASPGCPGWEAQSSWANVAVPVLVQTGDGDCVPYTLGAFRRQVFAGIGSSTKYLNYASQPGCEDPDPDVLSCRCVLDHSTFNLYGDDTCNEQGELRPPVAGDMQSQLQFATARQLVSATTAFLDAHVNGVDAAATYLASDRLEVLGLGRVDWQGDPALNGACTDARVAMCTYEPARTYPVREIGTPRMVSSYYTVHTTSW